MIQKSLLKSLIVLLHPVPTLLSTHWVLRADGERKKEKKKYVKRLLLWLKAQSFGVSPTWVSFQAYSYMTLGYLLTL